MGNIWARAREQLEVAQQNQSYYYNLRRVERELVEGDLVLLNISGASRDVEAEDVTKKLRCQWYGPYRVKSCIMRRNPVTNQESKDTLNYLIEPAHPNVQGSLARTVVHIRRLKKLTALPEKYRTRVGEIELFENDIADMDDPPVPNPSEDLPMIIEEGQPQGARTVSSVDVTVPVM